MLLPACMTMSLWAERVRVAFPPADLLMLVLLAMVILPGWLPTGVCPALSPVWMVTLVPALSAASMVVLWMTALSALDV